MSVYYDAIEQLLEKKLSFIDIIETMKRKKMIDKDVRIDSLSRAFKNFQKKEKFII